LLVLNNRSVEETVGLQDAAARCLAFGGEISGTLWQDFCQLPANVLLVLQACKRASSRIAVLLASAPEKRSVNAHNGYIGYDERDIAEFNVEGYDMPDNSQYEEEVARINDAIMVWFLLLYQILSTNLVQIPKKIIACRARKNTRFSSRRMAKKDSISTELSNDIDAEDLQLDNFDLVTYFVDLTSSLLVFLVQRGLTEDAHNQCIRVLTAINALVRLRSVLYSF
jgi:hypothetical protein